MEAGMGWRWDESRAWSPEQGSRRREKWWPSFLKPSPSVTSSSGTPPPPLSPPPPPRRPQSLFDKRTPPGPHLLRRQLGRTVRRRPAPTRESLTSECLRHRSARVSRVESPHTCPVSGGPRGRLLEASRGIDELRASAQALPGHVRGPGLTRARGRRSGRLRPLSPLPCFSKIPRDATAKSGAR